jgi:hypothetical protein
MIKIAIITVELLTALASIRERPQRLTVVEFDFMLYQHIFGRASLLS